MSGRKGGLRLPALLLVQGILLLLASVACARLATPEGWSAAAVAADVEYRGVTYEEVVYIGTREGQILALDGSSGDALWAFELRGEEDRRAIYGTPTLHEGALYVGGYDGVLYVLTTDGRDLDELDVGAGDPIVGSPVIADDIVLVGSSDGHLYAYNIAGEGSDVTLVERWKVPTGGKVWSTPAVADGIVYFGSLDRKLYAVNLSDGSPVWTEPFEARGAMVARPVVDGGIVYIGAFDSVFYAVDAATGQEAARFGGATGWFWAGAVISDGVVFAPSLDGSLYALAADGLNPVWSEPLRTGGPIVGAPAIVGDRITVPSLDNKVATVHSVRLSDGGAIEQCSFGSKNSTQIKASLTSHEGYVYVAATDRSIRKLEMDARGDPHEDWVRFTDQDLPASSQPGWAREC